MTDWASCYNPSDPVVGADFYGRTEYIETLVALVKGDSNRNIFLLGLGRIGKTSLLRHVMYEVKEREDCQGSLVAYIDFEEAKGDTEEIMEGLTGQLKKGSKILKGLGIDFPFTNFNVLIEKIALAAQDKSIKVTLFCDEIGRLKEVEAGESICNAIARNLPNNDYFKVVATSDCSARNSTDNPQYFREMEKFFRTDYLLGLNDKEAEQLCTLSQTCNVPIPKKVIAKVIKKTGGHPALIQRLCSEYFTKKENFKEAEAALQTSVSENLAGYDIDKLDQDDRQILDLLAEKGSSKGRLSHKTGRPRDDVGRSLDLLMNLGIVRKVFLGYQMTIEVIRKWLLRKKIDAAIKRLKRSQFFAWLLLAILTPPLLTWCMCTLLTPLLHFETLLAGTSLLLMAVFFSLLALVENRKARSIFKGLAWAMFAFLLTRIAYLLTQTLHITLPINIKLG